MLIEKNPKDIKEMFNKISTKYDFINNIISFFTHKIAKFKAIKALKIKDNSKILDLCCGSGDFAIFISNKYANSIVYGLDFSPLMLEIAKNKNKKITFIESDATNTPFNNSEFDYITMGFGLRNIKNYNKCVKEINRILKPNGKFLHLDFNPQTKLNNLYDKIILQILKIFIKDLEPYKYLLSSKNSFLKEDELITLFNQNGFKLIKSKKIMLNMISFQIFLKT
mgnify:CR=1 FL=1